MKQNSRILVLGAHGMVGSSLMRALHKSGFTNVLGPTRQQLNLMSQAETMAYFDLNRPEFVFDAAAKVGGIMANSTYPADFIFQNLTLQNNIFEASHKYNVRRLLFLGSSCIYPKLCPQPIKEEYLLTSPLEPTNEFYALAKITGVKMAEAFRRQHGADYISVMPTNMYGENDNYHPENSHVIPGLMGRLQKCIDTKAPEFVAWGTGTVRREFMYVDDLASACLHLMGHPQALPNLINVGTGEDLTIRELVETLAELMGYQGKIVFDTTKPDGTPRKLLDVSLIHSLGWRHSVGLREGLTKTIQIYRESVLTSGIRKS